MLPKINSKRNDGQIHEDSGESFTLCLEGIEDLFYDGQNDPDQE